MTIRRPPTIKPGMMPPANNAPMEIPPALASTIIMIDGGMIPPIVELTAVMAAANSGGYPAFFMPGTSSDPTVAVSATTEPFMPAKNMETSTFACAMLPRIRPIIRWLRSTKRSVIVAEVISSPVSMKKGMAVSGTESMA